MIRLIVRLIFFLLLLFYSAALSWTENIPVIYVSLEFPDDITKYWDVPNLEAYKQEREQRVVQILSNTLPAWAFKLRTGQQFPHLRMRVERKDNDLTCEARLILEYLPVQSSDGKDWSLVLVPRGSDLPEYQKWDDTLSRVVRTEFKRSSRTNPGIFDLLKSDVPLGNTFYLDRSAPWAALPINVNSYPCLRRSFFRLAVQSSDSYMNLISDPGSDIDYPPNGSFKAIKVTFNMMLQGVEQPQEVPIPNKERIPTDFTPKEFYLYAFGTLGNCDPTLSEAPPGP